MYNKQADRFMQIYTILNVAVSAAYIPSFLVLDNSVLGMQSGCAYIYIVPFGIMRVQGALGYKYERCQALQQSMIQKCSDACMQCIQQFHSTMTRYIKLADDFMQIYTILNVAVSAAYIPSFLVLELLTVPTLR